jgi:hypothetical protein
MMPAQCAVVRGRGPREATGIPLSTSTPQLSDGAHHAGLSATAANFAWNNLTTWLVLANWCRRGVVPYRKREPVGHDLAVWAVIGGVFALTLVCVVVLFAVAPAPSTGTTTIVKGPPLPPEQH